MSQLRKSIGQAGFYRLEEEIEKQRQKAHAYFALLEACVGVSALREEEGTAATYPFVTLVFDDREKKKRALRELNRYGLGVSQIYAAAITDYDYLREIVPAHKASAARSFAGRHLTLTTSTYLSKEDLAFVAGIIKKC